MKSTFFDKYKFSILSFLLTWFLGILIFSLRGQLIGGKYVFAHGDMSNQMISASTMFLRQLFTEHNLLYSFEYGLGGSTLPLYAFYACFSPFNIILMLPFGVNINGFLLVFARLSTGAFAFHELIRIVRKQNDYMSMSLSLLYAFSGFYMAYYHIIIWQDGIYLLPIIIIMIYGLFQKKKNPWLIIAYSILFVFNFYSGYVIGIYSFLFFILYCFLIYDDKSNRLKILIRYLLYVLLSMMIASVILLPTAISVLNATATDDIGFGNGLVSAFDFFKQFFVGQASNEVGFYPYVYSGLFSIIVLPAFFLCKDIKKKNKIFYGVLLGFLAFCTLTLPGYKFIHAFNAPDNFGHRYAYLYTFTILFACSCVYKKISAINKKWIIIIGGAYCSFIVLYYFINKNNDNFVTLSNSFGVVFINVLFIVTYVLLFIYMHKKKSMLIIASSLIVCELILNSYLFKDIFSKPLCDLNGVYELFYEEEKSVLEELQSNDKTLLPETDTSRVVNEDGRIYYPVTMLYNSPQLFGYKGIDVFSSLLNQKVVIMFRKFGYCSDRLHVSELGSTPPMRMILNQKYSVVTNDLPDAFVGEMIDPYYYNNDALPIAFMSSNDINKISLNNLNNPFDNIDELLSGLCGEKIDYFYNTGANITIDCSNVVMGNSIYNDNEVVGFEIDNIKDKYGYISFLDETTNSKYAYFEMLDSYAYDDSPFISGDLNTYSLNFKPFILSEPSIVPMCEKDSGTYINIIMDENTASNYYFKTAYFYGENDDELLRAYNMLSLNEMKVDTFRDGYIKGEVSSNDGKEVLFTTIPYEEGWDLYIDGDKADIVPLIDNTLIGAMIPYGTHEVVLKYTDKWAIKGGAMSLVGVSLAIVVFVIELKKKTVVTVDDNEGDIK